MAGVAVDFLSGSGLIQDAGGNYAVSGDSADTGNSAVLGNIYGDTCFAGNRLFCSLHEKKKIEPPVFNICCI